MKKLVILSVLCIPVAQAQGGKLYKRVSNAILLTGMALPFAVTIFIHRNAVVENVEITPSLQADADEVKQRDYQQLIQRFSVWGEGIDSDEIERFVDKKNLSASDYDGLTIYYVQGVLHTSGTAIAIPELGAQILLVKKDGRFNQLIHTNQVVGVAIDDSEHLGLPIAVPTEESEYEWQPVPHEITADLEAIIQRGHLIHGDVLQQFTGGQLLVASSYTVDKNGKITPLENPRNIFAPASKVTWFDPDAPIPTATKCEQCHDAEFPNED